MFLVYGHTGYLGSLFVSTLASLGRPYALSASRLENFDQIEEEISNLKPSYVIVFAGLKGTPNIDWFEKSENMPQARLINVDAQVHIAKVCKEKGIHCTVLSTGFLYNYDSAHPHGSGIGFKEDEKPNWDKLQYVKLKIELEESLRPLENTLILRINLPISRTQTPANFLAKFMRLFCDFELPMMATVQSVPIAITVCEDLWPVLVELVEKNITGLLNFVNPGIISHDDILKLYRQYVKIDHKWEAVPPNGSRPACELDVSRAEKILGRPLKPIRECVEDILRTWSK